MHLFFDLDGTLTDSSPGIIRCINYALGELGKDATPDEHVRSMIGRPLTTIFSSLLSTTETELLDRAVTAYRCRFDEIGIFENSLMPGMLEALDELRSAGHRLRIVTAKLASAATRVVEHFKIADYFDAVHGPGLHARSCDKADLIAVALQHANGDRRRAVMIGDHADDVVAARRQGVRAIAVGWGYGSRRELEAAEPDYLAEQVDDLLRCVRELTVNC